MKNCVTLEGYQDILTPKDLQDILHISRTFVYKYLSNGTIKSVRIGKCYRIPKTYLQDFLTANTSCEEKTTTTKEGGCYEHS